MAFATLVLFAGGTASAQSGDTWTWSTQGGGAPPPYGAGATAPSRTSSSQRTDWEIAALYGTAAAYGVGAGIWLDAETGIVDPGLRFIPPAILGIGMPVGVYVLDHPAMPRGMPAAISAGMLLGAGEGIGIASYQFVRSKEEDAWGFRGLSRSVFLGSTLGAGVGYLTAVTLEPSPKTSLLLGSSALWGTVVGSMFGYGGSAAASSFGDANDSASLGGLVGYNLGLVGAAAVSSVYVPSYESLTWMWIGFGAGVAVSTPVYLFYAGSEHDARRGLIFQGTAATLGLLAGAIWTLDTRDSTARNETAPPSWLRLTGGGLLPVRGGMGLQVTGVLF